MMSTFSVAGAAQPLLCWLATHRQGQAPFTEPGFPRLQADLHYNGFCNSVLWQLFHYVPLNTDTKLSETRTLQFQWVAHQEANRCALRALLEP